MNYRHGFLLVALFGLLVFGSANSKEKELSRDRNQPSLQKPGIIEMKYMDINSIRAMMWNQGLFFDDNVRGPGFEWPKGGGVHAIYSSSMWIGAKVGDTIKVATVGHHATEHRPGMIISPGVWDDWTKSEYRVYRVRPMLDDVTNIDFAQWPIDQGAPWFDANGNGEYEPAVGDKPALLWGDEYQFPDMLQYYVYNDADPAKHNHIWGGSHPLGAEVRQTNWAFDRAGPFGQMMFMRFEIINKSGRPWENAYFSIWSDPDLGEFTDDGAGVDTTIISAATGKKRNLGYTYNGTNLDAQYGAAPPAVGYTYFQGPIVPGAPTDTALWSGRKLPGFRNLNLTGFNFYCNPTPAGCPSDMQDPSGFVHTYNLMQGLKKTGEAWIDPTTGRVTTFVFAGDPVTGTGWTQANTTIYRDVRFTMTAGPVNVAAGDTQQVVVGVIVGRGTSNLNSITVLRTYADVSHWLFDRNFKLPSPPSTPKVTANWVEGSLILSWDSEAEKYDVPDPLVPLRFHGYNVYQTDDPLLRPGAKIERVASFYIKGGASEILDLVEVEGAVDDLVLMKVWKGDTEGIHNFLRLDADPLTRKPFVTGKPYYFIVTSFAYSPSAEMGFGLRYLETSFAASLTEVVPRNPVAGSEATYRLGEAIPHNRWISDEILDDAVMVETIDPWGTRDRKLRVTFGGVGLDVSSWILWDDTSGSGGWKRIASGQNFAGDRAYPVVSGVMARVTKLPAGVRRDTQTPKGWSYNRTPWFRGHNAPEAFVMDAANAFVYPTATSFIKVSSGLRVDSLRRVEIRFSTTQTQRAYRYVTNVSTFPSRPPVHPEYVPYIINRRNPDLNYVYQDYERHPLGNPALGNTVPFTVWEVDPIEGTERQLNIAIVERNDTLYRVVGTDTIFVKRGNVDGKWSPSDSLKPYDGDEVLIIFASAYSETPLTQFTGAVGAPLNLRTSMPSLPVMYAVWLKRLSATATWNNGDVLVIRPNYQITAASQYEFQLRPPTVAVASLAKAREELQRIKVVPNPYYGLHTLQKDPFDTYVTFTNLPAKCTIRIFNLAGDIVRIIRHDYQGNLANSSTRWDLKNHRAIPVASGMYIAHIEADEIGEKILKFAIFIQEERLDAF